MSWLIAIVAAYLAGSIPFGLLLGRLRGIDIREHGSRNIGATNVGRVLGRPLGLLCFLLDALKGAIPVAAAGIFHGLWGRGPAELAAGEQWLWLATAFAALLGHMFSPWLGFRGGKGVATGFGALCAMWPALTAAALGALAVWLLCVAVTRFISVASMLAAATVPLVVAGWAARSAISAGAPPLAGLQAALPLLLATALLAALVAWKHRANIGRLRRGEEPRVGGART